MQVKLKNANAVTRIMLAHGEKLGIAAVGAVALLLVWKSLGREKLGEDKQPPALVQKAQDADRHVRSVTWQKILESDEEKPKESGGDDGALVLTPINPELFPPSEIVWNPPVIKSLSKRTDPLVLPPIAPEVNGGAGLWLSGDPAELNKKRLEMMNRQMKEQQEADAEAAAAAREDDDRRGGRRRGERDRGEGPEGGMFAGGAGGTKTKDGTIIMQPASGAQLQGIEDIRNRYWVTVLAKVPIAQQYQMYEDALKNTRGYDPARDAPLYEGYQVQRAEVTDKGQGPWQSLGSVLPEGVAKVMGTWPPVQTTDPVNPRYNHPLLTFPLPPMIIRQWGEDITHSELPLQSFEDMFAPTELEAPPADEPLPDEGEEDEFAKAIEKKRLAQANQLNGGMNMQGLGPEGGMLPPQMQFLPAGSNRGAEGGGMYGGPTTLGAGGEIVLPPYNWDRQTEFILFRYFDSRVQPGGRYRYRIRLVLADVNAGQPETMLDLKVLERKAANKSPYYITEWSEESPVATVPQPGLVFVKGAKISPNLTTEPEAELLIKSLDSEFAAEIALKDFFARGSVLNLKQKAQVIWSSLYDPANQPESPDFEFFTGLTLLDFDGGEKLTNRSLLAPVRVLLMDSSGRMMLENELDDVQPIGEFEAIIEASKAAASQNRNNDNRRGRGGRGPER